MKIVPMDKVIYTFDRNHEPVEYVSVGEPIVLEALDAVGGQIKSEDMPLDQLDWSKVDQATGPIYINGVEEGDTLIVDILDIELADRGVCLAIPGYGVLGKHDFPSKAKFVKIKDGFVIFNENKLLVKPVIGTIGVAPYGDPIPTAVPYKHGGNLDCSEVTRGARLYLPVAVNGALFAAGDIHAVQGDGELCVAAVEIPGRMLFKFGVIKGRQPTWPIVEYVDHYSILTSDESLEKAVELAAKEAVYAIMNATGWSFEEAYIFSSLTVDIKINQVVDPKKGVRAVIPKSVVTIKDFLREKTF